MELGSSSVFSNDHCRRLKNHPSLWVVLFLVSIKLVHILSVKFPRDVCYNEQMKRLKSWMIIGGIIVVIALIIGGIKLYFYFTAYSMELDINLKSSAQTGSVQPADNTEIQYVSDWFSQHGMHSFKYVNGNFYTVTATPGQILYILKTFAPLDCSSAIPVSVPADLSPTVESIDIVPCPSMPGLWEG